MQRPSEHLKKLSRIAQQKGHPFKVLIVDDEQWIREVFEDFCELTDVFEVDLAASGREAIDKITCGRYDLVTLDLIMPEMSGLEALAEIKRRAPRMPVMVVTGNATDKLVNEAGVLGACQVIYKPVLLDDFISAMVTTLSR